MDDQTTIKGTEHLIDDQLVARYRAGDERAFDDLVAIHINRLFAFAFDVLRQREDAEEVTQEVLIKLHRQITHAHTPGCLRAWLYRVCMNVCIDRQRANKRRPAVQEFVETADSLQTADPAQAVAGTLFRESVEAVLAGLPHQQRMAFTLCHFAGLSVVDTAKALRCAPATVRVHLSRATAKLREALSKEAARDEYM